MPTQRGSNVSPHLVSIARAAQMVKRNSLRQCNHYLTASQRVMFLYPKHWETKYNRAAVLNITFNLNIAAI
ncbi:MAG: hypothetical protein OHK0023_08740 [Anaerolineae bacterium]